jgi:hypothetical protein
VTQQGSLRERLSSAPAKASMAAMSSDTIILIFVEFNNESYGIITASTLGSLLRYHLLQRPMLIFIEIFILGDA